MRFRHLIWMFTLLAPTLSIHSETQIAQNCQLVTEGHSPRGRDPVQLKTLISGLEVPWGIGFLPSGNYLVTERPGRVRLVRKQKLEPTPILELNVGESGEGGLLGIAIHPQFNENRYFYLYYTFETEDNSFNRVERFKLSRDEKTAVSDKIIINRIPAGVYHNGGRIRFGSDGYLYVATGDARDPNLAQNQGSPAGKLLRITPDGDPAPQNPWPNNSAWLTGIRNLQAFDWIDPSTLIVADHGPSGELGRTGNDEISIAKAGGNLGWPTIWGCQRTAGMVSPEKVWVEPNPPGGGAIYTGKKIPGWQGNFIMATLGSEHPERVILKKSPNLSIERTESYFDEESASKFGRLREVIMGPDGDLYITTSNCDGRGTCPDQKDLILKLIPA